MGFQTRATDTYNVFNTAEHDRISVCTSGHGGRKRIQQSTAFERNVHQMDASQCLHAGRTIFVHALGFRSTGKLWSENQM